MARTTLTGAGSPLRYTGVNSPNPPNFIVLDRAPVSGTKDKDIKNFKLGDIWLDSTTDIPYMLVDMEQKKPTWTSFGGTNTTYTTDSGTATEAVNNINVLGGDLLNTAGSGDTVTANLDRGTSGQIIVAATGAASAYANLTSSDSSITITEGANTLDITTGSAVTIQFDADTGSAVPSSGVITIAGGDNITTSASGSTVTVAVDDTTDHAVQIGNASGSLSSSNVGGDGEVLLGATGADPAFATLTSTGGTISFTPGANSLNLEASGATTSFDQINTQVFTAGGTYTPTSGMQYCIVECVGGGGGGAGVAATSSGEVNAGGGGGGGGYARSVLSSATVGASQTVTIGSGGAGGIPSNTSGTNGTSTSFGSLVVAGFGQGGAGTVPFPSITTPGGPGGDGITGDILATGGYGGNTAGIFTSSTSFSLGGYGGDSYYGAGGKSTATNTGSGLVSPPTNGTRYGGGGSGPAISQSTSGQNGGDGSDGIVIVTEYISV